MHNFKLSFAAVWILRHVLASPRAFTTTADIYRAGELLSKLDASTPPSTVSNDQQLNDWLKAQPAQEIEVTEGQREACKTAVRVAIEGHALPASQWLCELMRTLGLAPE